MASEKPKPITSKTGSKNFLKELIKRKFLDAHSILLEMKGKDVTEDFFREHGFRQPILVKDITDLGIKIPPVTDLNILLKFLVPDLKEVDVIDVEKQDTFRMSVIEYFKYVMNPDKSKILNLISMEVSKTRLSEFIEPPKIVRDIDWVHCYWNRNKEGHKPNVLSATEKYCLISPSNSFTDFHVDFSGTSVWYHVVTGVKNFYLVRPNTVNNHLFWKWSSSYHKEAQFFGDQVDECYKITIQAGETLLLPTGWIHAVYTPIDSLVYGGNFLNSYNVEEQFAVYDMELKEKVVEKYVHPHFRELNWFAAEGLCKEIDSLLQTTDILSVPYHLINAIKVALPNLKGWSTKLSVQEKSFYNSDQLFKDMSRVLRLHEKAVAMRSTEKRESTRVKKRPHSEDFILYDDFKTFTQVKKTKAPAESGASSGLYSRENDEDSSSDAWKVKTDAKNMLGVIIKRCSSATDPKPDVHTPATSSVIVKRSDSPPIIEEEPLSLDASPRMLNVHTYDSRFENSPVYKVSPLKPPSKNAVMKTKSPSSSATIRIKRARDWSSIVPSHIKDEVGNPLVEEPPRTKRSGSKLTSTPPEDPVGHSVHQDDDYIYPALEFSDDEEPSSQSTGAMDDEAWSPSSKSISVTPKSDRPQRVGKTKIAIEKGLEAAAANKAPNAAVFPPRKFIPIKKPNQNRPKPSSSTPTVSKGNTCFACDNCHKSYRNQSSLGRHVKYECSKLKKMSCPFCNHQTKRRDNLYKHIAMKHPM